MKYRKHFSHSKYIYSSIAINPTIGGHTNAQPFSEPVHTPGRSENLQAGPPLTARYDREVYLYSALHTQQLAGGVGVGDKGIDHAGVERTVQWFDLVRAAGNDDLV
jgi:hypothetical protein